MKNTPAFQYYPNDNLADPLMLDWDMEAVGAYTRLRDYLWVMGGKVEFNLKVFCRLFNVNRRTKAGQLWDKIRIMFVEDNGVITHQGLTIEMQKQAASRVRRQQAGLKGAKARWDGVSNAIEKPMAENGSSSSSSTSTSVNISNYPGGESELAEVLQAWSKANGITDALLNKGHVLKWQEAVASHGKEKCLEYIGRFKATVPGWIISRMNKDATNEPINEQDKRKKNKTGNNEQSGESEIDWQSVKQAVAGKSNHKGSENGLDCQRQRK